MIPGGTGQPKQQLRTRSLPVRHLIARKKAVQMKRDIPPDRCNPLSHFLYFPFGIVKPRYD